MFLRILGSPWALVAAWIIGPAVLILIRRRNKAIQDAEYARASGGMRAYGAKPAATPAPKKDRETAVTPAPTPTDIVPGFRDIKWGDAPAAGMELVSESGGEAVYTKHGELLRVEDVPVEAIHYIFSAGQFAATRVDAPLHAGDPLLRALTQHWGAPDTQDARSLKQQWSHLVSGPMATAAVLEKSPVSRRTTLFIFRKVEKHPVP